MFNANYMVVAEVNVRFLGPARFDDEVETKTKRPIPEDVRESLSPYLEADA